MKELIKQNLPELMRFAIALTGDRFNGEDLVQSTIEKIIKKYSQDIFAIETLFFSKNRKTALMVSEARGVLLYIANKEGLEIREFSPAEVKIGVTGFGRSTKDQIISMVPKIIRIEKKIRFDDEFDAIAVGITCEATKKFE